VQFFPLAIQVFGFPRFALKHQISDEGVLMGKAIQLDQDSKHPDY